MNITQQKDFYEHWNGREFVRKIALKKESNVQHKETFMQFFSPEPLILIE